MPAQIGMPLKPLLVVCRTTILPAINSTYRKKANEALAAQTQLTDEAKKKLAMAGLYACGVRLQPGRKW